MEDDNGVVPFIFKTNISVANDRPQGWILTQPCRSPLQDQGPLWGSVMSVWTGQA